jgi:hypothetical protein
LAALACGCGQEVQEEAAPEAEAPPPRLGDSIDTSLAELLGKPRAELAAMADDWAARAQLQEQYRRERRVEYTLLPAARFPLVVPALRGAHFSPETGFSLPPYTAEGTADSDLALHLARYGDDEAARKLAAANDAQAKRRIDECRYERTYPVEWTRLVGLMLHVAQMRLAQDESDAATELVVLHRQLREVLDAKAAHGPLGAALLHPGRQALAQAATAWHGSQRTELLANDIEAALAGWGEAPTAVPAVAPGTGRTEIARMLRSPGQGRVVAALTTARALDLFDLPLPPEGAQAVLALFDGSDRLSEILVTYRPGVSAIYPTPRELANVLEQDGVSGKDSKTPGLLTRSYAFGGFTCEAVVVSRGNPVGAFARLGGEDPATGTPPRDLGIVHLDRGFEQNRVRLAPEDAGPVVRTERPAVLARLKNPLSRVKPTLAAVERAGDQDVTARVHLAYEGAGGSTLHETALRLWSECGPGRINGLEDENGGHLVITWQDARTKISLRWPYASGEALELDAEDVSGTEPARRAVEAAAFDRQERRDRLESGAPLTRLPRYLDSAAVRLGATRAQVQPALPRGESVVKRNVADGIVVNFTGEPPQGAPQIARQSFIRCDTAGKVVELRTRYGPGTASANWSQVLLNDLKRRYGTPAQLPATWAQVWADLPALKPAAALCRWQDDITVLTCQRDAWGVELILRDVSGPDPAPEVLAAPQLLPRGPEGEAALGATRDDALKAAGGKSQTLEDGALLLAPRSPGLYDALFVWLDGDRVTRLVARYAQQAPPKAKAPQLTRILSEAWGRDARAFGWPARQDAAEGTTLPGLGWQDEHTRVRLFWQESDNGPARLYTEWKDLQPR